VTAVEAPLPTLPIIRPWLGDEEAEAAAAAIRSGWIAQGPNVAAFEADFAAAVGAAQAVALSNCTTALHLALVALDLRAGDEVVVPSFSFIATTNAVVHAGATPVYADVDLVTGNVTADSVAAVATDRTRAVIVVHQGGVPADLVSIAAWAGRRGVAVVEDAACAIGSTYRGRRIGADSPLVAFSFHPRKLVTTGEGGMLTVADPDVATRVRRLREHGMSVSAADRHALGGVVIERYLETAYNYRMTDVQAAVGRVQLGRLDAMLAERRSLASRYHDAIAEVAGVRAVADPAWGTTNYQSFWVLLDESFPVSRDDLMARFAAAGVSTRRGIMAAHREPAGERFVRGPLPVTDRLTTRSLILPLFHGMTDADQERVVAVLRTAAA
jgi:perosamine synthetase